MSKEKARERIGEIEKEQRKINRAWLTTQLTIAALLIGRMFFNAADLPVFLQHEYLYNAFVVAVLLAVVLVFVQGRKYSRERDEILAQHGIW